MGDNDNYNIDEKLQIDELQKSLDKSLEKNSNDDNYILSKERPSEASKYSQNNSKLNRFTIVDNNFQEEDSCNNELSDNNITKSERLSYISNDSKTSNVDNHSNNNINNKEDNKKKSKKNKNNENQIKKIIDIKLILLGDVSVGKTSILKRYIDNSFNENYQCTLNVDFRTKYLDIDLDTSVRLKIWDTVGQEKFRNLTTQYFRDCNGAIIVFDLTKKTTFECLPKWIEELYNKNSNKTPILIVGNKSDLTLDREVIQKEINDFVKDKYLYYDVSAKTGNNISLAFDKIRGKILEELKKNDSNDNKKDDLDNLRRKTIDLDNLNESVNGKTKKCC